MNCPWTVQAERQDLPREVVVASLIQKLTDDLIGSIPNVEIQRRLREA
jgi:hypothetical protein